MEESADGISIVNEVTGNWYNNVAGIAKGYAYREPCAEFPCFRVNPVAEEEKDRTAGKKKENERSR
jgi:hypothetical protein